MAILPVLGEILTAQFWLHDFRSARKVDWFSDGLKWQGWDVDLPQSSIGWGYYKAQSGEEAEYGNFETPERVSWDQRKLCVNRLAQTCLWMSGLYNQDGRRVIWNNSASIEKRHLDALETENLKKKPCLEPCASFFMIRVCCHLQLSFHHC